jgi:hypothetical protein
LQALTLKTHAPCVVGHNFIALIVKGRLLHSLSFVFGSNVQLLNAY